MKRYIGGITVALVAAALAAGCVSSDKLVTTEQPTVGTPLLARYVSMGNSITAGFQSGGINDDAQQRAYPVLLAKMADVPFTYPSLGPGCPALYTSPLNSSGILSANIPGGCALRTSFTGLVNNVAVPATWVADLTATGAQTGKGASNALSTFILGGLTQVQAMQAMHPTFVSLWAPNNDVLTPVNAGDTTLMPTAAAYLASFNAAVDGIKAAGTQLKGALLIGVVDVPMFAPIVQPGAFFYAAYSQNPNQFGKPVDPSCSPFTAQGQPNPYSGNLVSFHVAADPTVTVIRCTPDAKYVTTTSVAGAGGGAPEIVTFETRIALINAGVKAAATANGWIYVDPNTALGNVVADPSKLRKCQALRTATDLPSFLAAVVSSCPGPTAPGYFGSLSSLDATHPSTEFHKAFAVALADSINKKYGTSISLNPPNVGVFAR